MLLFLQCSGHDASVQNYIIIKPGLSNVIKMGYKCSVKCCSCLGGGGDWPVANCHPAEKWEKRKWYFFLQCSGHIASMQKHQNYEENGVKIKSEIFCCWGGGGGNLGVAILQRKRKRKIATFFYSALAMMQVYKNKRIATVFLQRSGHDASVQKH